MQRMATTSEPFKPRYYELYVA